MSQNPVDSAADQVRQAISMARIGDYQPSMMIMHPCDAANLGICAWPRFRYLPNRIASMPKSHLRKRLARAWKKTRHNPWKAQYGKPYVWANK